MSVNEKQEAQIIAFFKDQLARREQPNGSDEDMFYKGVFHGQLQAWNMAGCISIKTYSELEMLAEKSYLVKYQKI
jgi:glutamate synthase domain-containing protein 1